MDYPDSNGNSMPDAFENRKPISEIEYLALLKRTHAILGMLKRGPKVNAVCWCTSGWYKPTRHSTACKATATLFAELTKITQ